MGEGDLILLREFIVTSESPPGEMRRAFSGYPSRNPWKILSLAKGNFLIVSHRRTRSKDSRISWMTLQDFYLEADAEIQEIGRVASVVQGADFRAHLLLDRKAIVVRDDGSAAIVPRDDFESGSFAKT